MKKELRTIQKEILGIQIILNDFLAKNNLSLEIHSDLSFALAKLVEANNWIEKAISKL